MIPIKNNRSDGFTLIELMIAMAIAGIVSAAMYATFQAQIRGQVSQDVSLQMTQNLRAVMEIIASDIRMAGCDPENAGAEIVFADDDELILTMDIRGTNIGDPPDGDVTDAGERIRYVRNGAGNLGREVNTQGSSALPNDPQPIHSPDLECNVLNFVYLDADGDPITPLPLSNDDREDVNAIQVSIVVQSADTAVGNPGFLRSFTDNTVYENLQGDVIFTPDDTNSKFRRFQLSQTIDCRNL